MRTKYIIITIFIVFLNFLTCYSQDLSLEERTFNNVYPVYPSAPSTAIFKKYGEIVNSEYTGTNSTKIELFTIEDVGVKIPISLDYVSGNGIKVIEEASPVGLGWNIPLPVLMQNVMGRDDLDSNYPIYKFDYLSNNSPYPVDLSDPIAGLSFCIGYDDNNNLGTINGLPQYYSYGYYKGYKLRLPICNYMSGDGIFNEGSNTEPDIFVVNLFGEKIEFTSKFPNCNSSNNNIYFVSLNKKGYSLQYINNSFTITDNRGINYIFTQKEDISVSGFGIKQRNYMLNKIIDIYGNEINFSYITTQNITNLVQNTQDMIYGISRVHNPPSLFNGGIDNSYSGEFNDIIPNQVSTGILINTSVTQNYMLLSEIVFNKGKVTFEYSDRLDNLTKKLDRIKLFDFRNVMLKEVNFNYSYFSSPNNTQFYGTFNDFTSKRLKLNSISNQGEDYLFEYFEDILLPVKTSYAVDYWGYSNGGNNNVNHFKNPSDFSIPDVSIPLVLGVNDNFKRANLTYSVSNMLKKIIFPTKGYSIFEYELNQANNFFSTKNPSFNIDFGNGVRLKNQQNYNYDNSLVSKINFLYEGGICMNPISFYKKGNYTKFWDYPNPACMGGINEVCANCCTPYQSSTIAQSVVYSTQNNNTFYALSYGNYVGYSKVTKQEEINNGKTVTFFKNTIGLMHPLDEIPKTKDNDTENGVILQQQLFDSDGNLIRAELNSYTTYLSDQMSYGVKKINKGLLRCVPGISILSNQVLFSNYCYYYYYPNYSKQSLLTSKLVKEYYSSGVVEKSYSYNYDNLHRLLITENAVFNGNVLIKNYSYPFTMLSLPNMAEYYFSKKVCNNIVQRMDLVDGNHQNTHRVVYEKDASTNNHILPKYIYTTKGNDPLEKRLTYDLYDNKQNVIQYTPENGIPISIIYGYNQTLPIAKIENATYSQVSSYVNNLQTLSNGTDEAALLTAFNNLRSNLPNVMVTTYTHIPLVGLSTVTDPKGDKQTYTYDSFGRLQYVKDKNGNILSENKYHYKP